MKKLTKSRKQKVIAGVCGGIAEYLNVDVTIIRMITMGLILVWGSGALAYLIAALIMPEPNESWEA